jgi:O-antigen ligase
MPPGQVIDGVPATVEGVKFRPRLAYALQMSSFALLVLILISGPLAFGIVQRWSVALFETASAITLLLWMAWHLADSEIRIRWSPLFAPMLAFLSLVITQIFFHLSAYIYGSLTELWFYLAYGILVFVAVQIFCSDHRFMVYFARILALFGAVYALFAVIQGFTSENRIYWLISPRSGNVYGSYVNHNHYAGFLELLLPNALVLAVSGSVRGAGRFLLGFAAMLMAASVFLSGSRGGMFAIVAETIFLTIVWMRRFSLKKSAAVFALFVLITASFLAWIAPQQVGSRMTDMHDPARWLIHRDSVRMFSAHPFLGSGFGTFPEVFPHYRVFYDGFFINHAHDDYLELLLDTGLIGFAIAVWFAAVLYCAGLRSLHPARHSPFALVRIAALAGCTGLLAHSLSDFNLHIPANAALFFVLCAVATVPASAGSRVILPKQYGSSI